MMMMMMRSRTMTIITNLSTTNTRLQICAGNTARGASTKDFRLLKTSILSFEPPDGAQTTHSKLFRH